MRSLGVIFLADVVGYSKMMANDEIGTLNLIREFQKETISPTMTKYGGNMIKSLGDGWLIEFKSASNAVNCAMAWQNISKKQGKMSLELEYILAMLNMTKVLLQTSMVILLI